MKNGSVQSQIALDIGVNGRNRWWVKNEKQSFYCSYGLMVLISGVAYAQYNVKISSIQVSINNQDLIRLSRASSLKSILR